MKKHLISFLRIFVSITFIVILLYIMRDKYAEIFASLKRTDIFILSLALLSFLCAISLASLRLKLIVEAQELKITIFEAVSLTFIGYFFNNFLPTAIGGDLVKAYYLSRKADGKMSSFASVFVDRLIGLITMIFMAFLALIIVGSEGVDPAVRYAIYSITIAFIVGIIFMTNKDLARIFSGFLFFLKPLEEKLKKAYSIVHGYSRHKVLMAQSIIISIVSQGLFFLSLGILAHSIGSRIPIIEIFLRIPIVGVLSLLPSINGLGLREGSMVVMFGPLIGRENAFAVSILWLFVLFVMSVIGGIVYGLSPQFKINLKGQSNMRGCG